jgi:hypothetical protein
MIEMMEGGNDGRGSEERRRKKWRSEGGPLTLVGRIDATRQPPPAIQLPSSCTGTLATYCGSAAYYFYLVASYTAVQLLLYLKFILLRGCDNGRRRYVQILSEGIHCCGTDARGTFLCEMHTEPRQATHTTSVPR